MLVKGGGTIVNKELAPGQVLRVTSGSLVAFESSVQYEVGMMPGIKNVMFGGEGLFVTTLTGPGQVWLQGMPPDRMIAEIARRVPGPGIGLGIPIGLGGGGGGDAGTAADTPGGVDARAAGVGDEASFAAAGGEEAVAATDAAIEADRQATVAASGMDADSQSALFGDTVSTSDTAASTTSASSATPDLESSSSSDSFREETTFGGDSDFTDQSTFSSETTFKDDFDDSFTDQQQGGDMFDDSTIEGLGGGEESAESGSSVLGFLWDLVTGRDD